MQIPNVMPTISLYAPDFAGIFLPIVIQIINKDVKNETTRFLISFGVCMITALFFKYNELAMGNVASFLTSLGIIFMEAQVVYKLYFKNSVLSAVINERLTKTDNGQAVG